MKAPAVKDAEPVDVIRWGIVWRSHNKLDGPRAHIHHNDAVTLTFNRKRLAELYIQQQWGYIASRPDLRAEPHGWFMPKAVRVRVRVEVA